MKCDSSLHLPACLPPRGRPLLAIQFASLLPRVIDCRTMLRPQEPILWIFHFDGSLPENSRCVHVNFIDRTDGTVRPKLRGYTLSHSVTTCPVTCRYTPNMPFLATGAR